MSSPASSQPALLDEIVRIAADSQQSLTELLRRCLILAYQLKNDELKSWLRQELDGYSSADGLPSYRFVHIGALGTFSDGYNSRDRVPLPSAMMKAEHRERAETVPLMAEIKAPGGVDLEFHWLNGAFISFQP